MALGRISNWASDLLFPLEGRAERRPHEVAALPARITQAGRQVLEADRTAEGWTFVAPSQAPLLSREARSPQRCLPAIPVASLKKPRAQRVQAWNFEDESEALATSTAESSKTDLRNTQQETSLLSVLQRRHQGLPSEIGGAPEAKPPQRMRGNDPIRRVSAGPARLSGGRAVPKMSVKQFLEFLENETAGGRPDEDPPKRQKYVFIEHLVPPRAHVSVARSRGATDEKEVVLKTIRKGWFVSSEEEEQWFRCTTQLREMDAHRGLCQVFDLWKEEDGYHVAMELVSGVDLFTMLNAEGTLPQRANQITKDVLQGLAVLHAQQLVHRDIKLQNVVAATDLSGSMKAKIIDFDTVWPMNAGGAKASRFVVGSDQYIAPEAYDGDYSPASDLFAVGVLCFALCFGRFPFSYKVFDDEPGENLVGSPKMQQIAQRLRQATIKWPEGQKEAADFCRWLLDMNPKNRPSDALAALKHPFLRLR